MAANQVAVAASVAALFLVAASFITLMSQRTTPTELIYGHNQHFESINDFDMSRPSWHEFDYKRPDFSNALDLNLLGGNSGFFKQQMVPGSSSLAFAFTNLPFAEPIGAVAVPEERFAYALAGKPIDERDALGNQERSEAARCNGMLHACTNWMALETGKMRVMIYERGSWCTDDDLKGPECYANGLEIAEDHVFDIPEEGGELSQELWDAITKSCPVMDGCAKPKAFSTTSAGSVYETAPAALAAPVEEYLAALRETETQCCVQRQTLASAAHRTA